MSLAPFVHAMARGPARARNLTRDEAREAMALILSGNAAPEAIGALFMLMRYRGETAEEIAGFVDAMRAHVPSYGGLRVDVDWPSYSAGRSRGLPLFLLSAKLVAQAGHRVLLHGWNSHQNPVADVRAALKRIGISQATTAQSAQAGLDADGIAYVPLEAKSERLLELLKLRDVLGLRSPVNTALRAWNPSGAALSVQGVFHPPYRDLQRDAAALLGQQNLLVLKGGGGEFERNPSKDIALHGLLKGAAVDQTAPSFVDDVRRMNGGEDSPAALGEIWAGALDDPFARAVVIGTAGLVLMQLENLTEAQGRERAEALWANRLTRIAA